jgi:hypothetical protein
MVQKATSFHHLRARKGVDAAHLTSETLQFIDSVCHIPAREVVFNSLMQPWVDFLPWVTRTQKYVSFGRP